MLITKKMLIALTLVGALLGAGIGSLITSSSANSQAAHSNDKFATIPATNAGTNPTQVESAYASQYSTTAEQAAYRQGFKEGFGTCDSARSNTRSSFTNTTYRAPVRRYSNNRSRVYYDYNNQPRGRSFWSKHRDKLTMAIGTGAGAGIGALIGGKKGAGIGALAGLGGSALYTYKLRKRTPRY